MNSANNPYSTSTISTTPTLDMNVHKQYARHKEEEKSHISAKQLPHPSVVLQEQLSQLFPILMNIRNTVKKTEDEPNVDKDSIEKIYSVIDHLGQTITFDLSKAIDKLYL